MVEGIGSPEGLVENRGSTAARGRALLVIAIVAAFLCVMLVANDADSTQEKANGVLWFVALAAGLLGTWWTSGNAVRMTGMFSYALALSGARAAVQLMPRAPGDSSLGRIIVATCVAAAIAGGLAWLAQVMGRANPDYPNTRVTWRATDDRDVPLSAKVRGQCWQVRINREPGAARYTLLVDHVAATDLTWWPDAWSPDARNYAR